MKSNYFSLIILGLFFSIGINAQVKRSITREEAYFYANRTLSFLDAHDSTQIKKTEIVLMFLTTDDAGRVTKITLLSNTRKRKSLWGILRKMKPSDFNDYRIIYGVRNRTVILPAFTIQYPTYPEDKNNPFHKLRLPPPTPFTSDDPSGIVNEGYNFIQLNGFAHIVPQKPYREEMQKILSDTTRRKGVEIVYESDSSAVIKIRQ